LVNQTQGNDSSSFNLDSNSQDDGIGPTDSTPTGTPTGTPIDTPTGTEMQCDTTGTNSNLYWVEFLSPSGVNGDVTAAFVYCNEGTYTCTYSSDKYQCPCDQGCTNPKATVGGNPCVLTSDSSDTSSSALVHTGGMIIGMIITVVLLTIGF